MAGPLLLVDVEVEGVRVDVAVGADGRVAAVGPDLPRSDRTVVDGGGGWLLPGLHDHHLHLLATAAARGSVAVGPADVDGPAGLVEALRRGATAVGPDGWVRAVGYHESVAGPLDAEVLDAAVADRPVRVQHRSGALWVLNSVALAAIGPVPDGVGADGSGADGDERPAVTGRFFRADAWLSARWPRPPTDLAAVGEELARYGVTGATDATPYDDVAAWRALAGADLPQRVVVTGGPSVAGFEAPDGLARGPVKLVVPDHRLPEVATVVGWVASARAAGRPVAVHCVTAEALVLTLAALAEVGPVPGDRIEHGAVVPAALVADVADLGLTVVTQPGFVSDRGDDYRRDVDAAEQGDLWRCASLEAGGVGVAAGTDAPYGRLDPWAAMRAAVDRRTASGAVLGAGERVDAERALALFLGPAEAPAGPPRRVGPGAPADLCLLGAPSVEALTTLDAALVSLTVVRGRVVHR